VNQPSRSSSAGTSRSPLTAAGVLVLTVVLRLAGFSWAMGLLTALALGVMYLASFRFGRVTPRDRPRPGRGRSSR